MKYNYLNIIIAIGLLFLVACEDKPMNPTLKDTDMSIFFWGKGGNISGEAWEGFNVLVGDTLETKLMVSPSEGTDVKWELEDGTVLNTTLNYTYSPTQEEEQRTLFIATRPSGYADTVTFNFRGVLEGYTSVVNQWQSIKIPQGTQTGEFMLEFDMTPSKDIIDAVVGTSMGVATTYSQLSTIVRFNAQGMLDAYDDNGYKANSELIYSAGVKYHVRMLVNAVAMQYDVYITPEDGQEVEIAKDYAFRNKITNINYWSLVAGDFNLSDPGTHRVSNMEITTISQNLSPIFMSINDIEMNQGETQIVQIEAIDPLGGNLTLACADLPRFASFTDEGYGYGTLTFSPYDDCGGCDVGEYDIKIFATNKVTTDSTSFTLKVIDPSAQVDIVISSGDGTIWGNGAIDTIYKHIFGGRVSTGVGGEDDVVAVMPVRLPALPQGKRVAEVQLKIVTTDNNSWIDVNYDLYALSARSNSSLLASDFYIGAYDNDANAIAIQEALITKGDAVGEVMTSEAGGASLAAFLNAEYASGAKEGEYVFLRVNANRVMDLWAHLQFKSADTDVPGTEPLLSIVFEDIP